MSFYILKNDHLQALPLSYLQKDGGRRLEKTIVPPEKAGERREGFEKYTRHYALEVMTKEMQVLDFRASVAEALELCEKIGAHHLILCDGEAIKGMVSDRDISWLKRIHEEGHHLVSQYMTELLLVCDEETPLDHLAHVMVKEKVSAFPVVDSQQKLVGIVTHNDLLKWIYE